MIEHEQKRTVPVKRCPLTLTLVDAPKGEIRGVKCLEERCMWWMGVYETDTYSYKGKHET